MSRALQANPTTTAATLLVFAILAPAPASPATQTMRAEVNAKSYAIAGGRHFAVEAGMRLFREGGNAFDAGAAAARRALIDPRQASLAHRPGTPPGAKAAAAYPAGPSGRPTGHTGDTTAVNAADAAGNLFSAVVSGAWLVDGAFIAGDTGVPLSQRMQQFSLDPGSPNLVAPRKRPRITLTPTVVLRDAKPYLAISTPGGDSQDQQNLNVLLAALDFGLPIQEALEAPRINSEHMRGSFREHRDQPGVLTIESRVPWEVIEELRRRGHDLRIVGPFRMPTAVTAVGFDPRTGTIVGGADVRGERAIAGW